MGAQPKWFYIVELLNTEFLGQPLRLEASMAGWQVLYWGNQPVAGKKADGLADGDFSLNFELKDQSTNQQIQCQLNFSLHWQPFSFNYELLVNNEQMGQGERGVHDIERQTPAVKPKVKRDTSMIGMLSLGFKLFKSAKIIKVVLAGASLAAYSWLFSLPFALSLLACLVVHEYGHIRAMKHFGMPTKGIYLIPFMGGLALSDGKINTRWQDVVISMMGPFFGLGMSLLALIAYWITGEIFFAGIAAFNSLLNLFNLLPILPLDGGHILKSISFSMNSIVGLVLCGLGAGLGVLISYSFGLALLGFLLLIGSIEIFFEWKMRHQSHLLPLDRYGQVFSAIWYLVTVAGLVGIIFYLAGTGDAMLGLPLKILNS